MISVLVGEDIKFQVDWDWNLIPHIIFHGSYWNVIFVHLCHLQRSSNGLVSPRERGMLGNWKGATGTSQADGDVVCVCVGRCLAGVKQPRIYQLPRWRLRAALARSHTRMCKCPIFLPPITCLFSSLADCCVIVFIYLSSTLFLFSWTLNTTSCLCSPLPSFPSSNASHPTVIFLLLHLCHWHSRGSTDARQRGRWESGRHLG